MTTEITSTHDLAEAEWDGRSEPAEVETDMTATTKPEGGIEFFVQMRDYTKRDMENLIIEAAARVVVGNYGNNVIAKKVEERCIALVTEMADRHLASVTKDIIDQPILPKYPFMKADAAPMTMREFIGLTGRDYLEARVDNSGNPTTDRSYSKPRLQHLVEGCVGRAYKNEIEKATNAAISEIQRDIKSKHDAFLAAEKARLREALSKLTGGA
jgi:hypothetical protein